MKSLAFLSTLQNVTSKWKWTDEKEPHSGGGLTALTECAALLGDGQQKCRLH